MNTQRKIHHSRRIHFKTFFGEINDIRHPDSQAEIKRRVELYRQQVSEGKHITFLPHPSDLEMVR